MLEAMSQYQSTYGLKPIGPHRRLADRLFRHSRRSCHACAGSGLASLSERAWSICRYCEGTGGFWDIPARRIEEIRAEILEAFPEAGAPTEILWGYREGSDRRGGGAGMWGIGQTLVC
jgi:hypothetical protein